MTGDLAGEAVEEQEKKEKMKIPKLKDNSALAKQTPGSPKRRMSLVERGGWRQSRESKHVKVAKVLLLALKDCLL